MMSVGHVDAQGRAALDSVDNVHGLDHVRAIGQVVVSKELLSRICG